MSLRVTIAVGQDNVFLPDGRLYNAGDSAYLTEEEAAQLSADFIATYLTGPPTESNEIFRASNLTINSSSNNIAANTVNAVNGRTGAIDISRISSGLLVVSVTNAPTGTSPTLAVFFDVQDSFGNWCLVSNATAISGAVLNTSGTTYGNITGGYALTDLGRIRWTLGGSASPTFTGVSFSLFGR